MSESGWEEKVCRNLHEFSLNFQGTIIYYMCVATSLTCLILGLFLGIWMGSHYKSFHDWLGYIVIMLSFIFPALGVIVDRRKEEFDVHGGPVFPHKLFRLLERAAIYA
jgi:hypothetical protein